MILGRKDKERVQSLEKLNEELMSLSTSQTIEILRLEKLEKNIKSPTPSKEDIIGFEAIDPSPLNEEERKNYVSSATSFFDMGFKDRLKYMAAIQKDYISKFPLKKREEDFYRASLNVIYLILEWGDELEIERAGYAQGDKEVNAFDTDTEEDTKISRLKDKVK